MVNNKTRENGIPDQEKILEQLGDTLCKPNTNNTKQAKDKGPRREGGLATAGDGQYSRRRGRQASTRNNWRDSHREGWRCP